MDQGWKRRRYSESASKHLQLWRAFSGQRRTMRQSASMFLSKIRLKMYFHSWICTYVIHCAISMAVSLSINRFQLSIKDMHWEFNGGHCSVGLVSQRGRREGGGVVWLRLAEREGDVIHQKQVTATVKCWKDIQSLPLLWGMSGSQTAAFSQNRHSQ